MQTQFKQLFFISASWNGLCDLFFPINRHGQNYFFGSAFVFLTAGSLIFQRKKVEGFWLSYWIADTPPEEFSEIIKDAQENLSTDFKSEINKRFSLEEGYKAIDFYKNNMTSGKVLFVP
jgi:hypothetical protein